MALKKTLQSPLDCTEIKTVNPKGNQSWIFIGRTDTEAEAPYFGHLMWRTDSLEKTLMLGKTEGRRRRTEDKMVGWYHRLDGHDFEQAPGVVVMDREAWRAVVYGITKSQTWLSNWTELNQFHSTET